MSTEATPPPRRPTYLPAPEPPFTAARATRAILFGILCIAVVVPLSQFLTLLTVHSAAETATPVAWAVGLVFSLVLCAIALRRIAGARLVSRRSLVLLYGMLAVAIPLMNVGLVRQVFLTLQNVPREYLDEGTATYRTAYDALEDGWFPDVPTVDGIAFAEADRSLRILQPAGLAASRATARRRILLSLEPDGPPADPSLARSLGPDEAAAILAILSPDSPLHGPVATRLEEASAASAAAAGDLALRIAEFGERVLSELPSVRAGADPSSLRRRDAERARLDVAAEARLAGRIAAAEAVEAALRQDVGALSSADLSRVRAAMASLRAAALRTLPPAARADEVAGFIYRLDREERRRLLRSEPQGNPDPPLAAIRTGLWPEASDRAARAAAPPSENLGRILRDTPWHAWLGPLSRWGLLALTIFLLLLCLAEWLRRKWIDRENVAFPLAEFADHLIRHDFRLELASEVQDPEPRRRPFYPLFWIGVLAGAAILSVEALGHYGLIPGRGSPVIDLNASVFRHLGGAFRTVPNVVLAISPIVLGIGYLLSLQVSFSIWATFAAWLVAFAAFRAGFPEIRDSSFTGFEGGRLYPFAMEQLLGAMLVVAATALWQARQCLRRPAASAAPGAPQAALTPGLIPHGAMIGGLAVLPVAAGFLLWDLGIRSVPFLLAMGVVMLAQAVAIARVRADTGLPPIPAGYEFTKLAIILGLPGVAGARVFTAFVNIAFLPSTLLLRSLAQVLENAELARRHRIPYPAVSAAALAAFLTALPLGALSLLALAHFFGEAAFGATPLPPQARPEATGIATYPLWVSHFLGEAGLARFDAPNFLRIGFIALGAGITGLLMALRRRFLGFPLHPVGYLAVLAGFFFIWVTPFVPPDPLRWETNTWWASLFLAWLAKKLVVKYGGMNTYRRGKPLFVGLAAGGVLAIFGWNLLHLAVAAAAQTGASGPVIGIFTGRTPFSPAIL